MTRPPAVLLAILLAGGCGRVPAVVPLLSLGDRICDSRPVFDGSVPIPFDQPAGAVAKLGTQSRCLQQPASPPTTYAVFALSAVPTPATLTITSWADVSLVAPRAVLYDAAGTEMRTLPPEEFRANVTGLQAGLRLHGGERWLLVAADGAKLGQPVTLRLGDNGNDRIRTAAVVFIYIPPPQLPDVTRTSQATYGLNGTIHVTMASVAPAP